jgi:NodT family efflux transporter outer membrane factor (OMF) lipoprotein
MLRITQSLSTVGAVAILCAAGCTGPLEYFRNGLKVGPNYSTPPAQTAEHWIDADDVHTCKGEDLSHWWCVFKDPVLDRLVGCAYRQNLSLREAGFRILEARAQLGIAQGSLFPQTQTATGSYQRIATSQTNAAFFPVPFYDQWSAGFNLAWEIDFWGRFRRAITAAQNQLDASVADYDQVVVTLLGDVASNYVLVRTDQDRIRWLRQNVAIQELVLGWIKRREQVGFRTLPLDVHQAETNLEQTIAGIPALEIEMRQAENRLCILLGMPPVDLRRLIGEDRIPGVPADVVIGIPAELLRRRPDVRRAERLAAAQAEQIGIAEAQLYPAFSITGTLGWQSQNFADLFSSRSLASNVGPSFQWNLLNYGRIKNNMRYQEARLQELITVYQQTVLQANEEVEDGLVMFLQGQKRTLHLIKSVDAANAAVKDIFLPTLVGRAGFDVNRYALIEQNKVQVQDLLAQARGQIAQGLIQVYRALGGGWEIRCDAVPPPIPPPAAPPTVAPEGTEELQKLRQLLEPQSSPERVPAPQPNPNK